MKTSPFFQERRILLLVFVFICGALGITSAYSADQTIPLGVTETTTQSTQVNSTFTNNGAISISSGAQSIAAFVDNATIINNGNIQGANIGITVQPQFGSGSISGNAIINNAGALISGLSTGIAIDAHSSISLLTNNGVISGSTVDISLSQLASLQTFNNAQGGNSASTNTTALKMQVGSYGAGPLPSNYNIIINSPTHYGQLAVTAPWGFTAGAITNFGIYAGSVITTKLYAGVLQGLTSNYVGATRSGTYGNFGWTLALQSGSSTIWDLLFPTYSDGPSTANTQQSLVNTASALQNIYTLQNSVLANSFSYDCTEFGANGICISAGGRNTAVSSANGLNNTSGLLIAAYRPHQNYRVGAYVDQNLSVNNAGSTVNLGNNTPLIGLFGAWNQRLDGTGTEVKVSAAYGQKNTTINRSVVGAGDTASEAGSGSSKLNSQGAQVTAKYGFGVIDNVIVSPYVGIRYTQNNMGGYTEGASSSVTAPLTYSALNTNATTALAGVGASYRGIPQTTLFASAGVETDTNTANGTYAGNNAYFNGGLTPVNFNANPVKTRPTATLGAYYDVVKNQRIGVTGIYRQEAYQAVSTTTVMATYTVGL